MGMNISFGDLLKNKCMAYNNLLANKIFELK